jgi:hypothetical protein
VDFLIRLRSPGIAKHQQAVIEQKPTPIGVSILNFCSGLFCKFGEFGEQEP